MIRDTRRETWIVIGIALIFLGVNLVTGSRSPTVWTDEVAYADPAINWVQNGTFTSTAWEVQRSDEHWAGNVPLYQWLLSGWLMAFGISITAVRALGYVLAFLAVVLLWGALRRARWIESPTVRLLVVVALLSGYGITYGYRAGRPDMLGFMLLSGGAVAWTLGQPWARYGALALIGALLPLAGLQFIPFAALLIGVGMIAAPGAFARIGGALGLGALAGGGALFGYYRYHGVWDVFWCRSVATPQPSRA